MTIPTGNVPDLTADQLETHIETPSSKPTVR